MTDDPTPHTGEGAASFRDLAGRTWLITIRVGSLRMLRNEYDLDLLQILNPDKNPLAQLADDPYRICDVLWALIKTQAAEAGVSEQEWQDSMAGDCLSEAANALIDATIDFFPHHRRAPLAVVAKRMRTAEAALTGRMVALAKSEAVTAAIDQQMTRAETGATARLETLLSGQSPKPPGT